MKRRQLPNQPSPSPPPQAAGRRLRGQQRQGVRRGKQIKKRRGFCGLKYFAAIKKGYEGFLMTSESAYDVRLNEEKQNRGVKIRILESLPLRKHTYPPKRDESRKYPNVSSVCLRLVGLWVIFLCSPNTYKGHNYFQEKTVFI